MVGAGDTQRETGTTNQATQGETPGQGRQGQASDWPAVVGRSALEESCSMPRGLAFPGSDEGWSRPTQE